MARPKRFIEQMVARFTEGTFARIQAVLRGEEDRADFVRDAVSREIVRRERRPAARQTDPARPPEDH